jgi:hypothetical protein
LTIAPPSTSEVEIDDAADHLRRGVREVAHVERRACVVDHTGDLPVERGRLEERVDVLVLGQVASHEAAGDAGCAGTTGDGLCGLVVAGVAEHEVVAVGCQPQGRRGADPAAAARDDGQAPHSQSTSALVAPPESVA